MDHFETRIGQADLTALGLSEPSPTRVIVQAGRFKGVEGELVEPFISGRALVRLQRGVLIEIDASVLRTRDAST